MPHISSTSGPGEACLTCLVQAQKNVPLYSSSPHLRHARTSLPLVMDKGLVCMPERNTYILTGQTYY